jgi:hypothetical protein
MRPTAEVASTEARRERVWDPTTWEILCFWCSLENRFLGNRSELWGEIFFV